MKNICKIKNIRTLHPSWYKIIFVRDSYISSTTKKIPKVGECLGLVKPSLSLYYFLHTVNQILLFRVSKKYHLKMLQLRNRKML